MFRIPCLLASIAFLLGTSTARAQQEMNATYLHGALAVSIPFHGLHDGAGRLEVMLLSPEDEVLAQTSRTVQAAAQDSAWNAQLVPTDHMAYDDLAWERVRVRFTFNGEQSPALAETRSVSEILRRPVVRVLGQSTLLAGSSAALRVYVSDGTHAAAPLPNGSVRVELQAKDAPAQTLFQGKLDRRGTVEADFHLPEGLVGDATLHIVAETPLGEAETTAAVHLQDKVSILLTTEKPVYQPLQTVHIRALALDRLDHHAAADRAITFEAEDARGNKVFRRRAQTDAFGVASAELPLADEVNFGSWHLRAIMPSARKEAAPSTAELTLRVERYVLPKFRVSVHLPERDGAPQRDFRPGDHVTGTVEARYFFGKPVSDAPLDIRISGFDASAFEAASAHGRTDADGKYRFDLVLPRYFAGNSAQHGAAPVVVEAGVEDNAGHRETGEESLTVSDAPLLIQAVPEAGRLVAGLDNVVYIVTSYPDGRPARASVCLRAGENAQVAVETGSDGVGVVHLQGTAANQTLHAEANDHRGKQAAATLHLDARNGDDEVLLRTDRAVYQHGETMKLSLLSTRAHSTAYVDLIQGGQTVLTRDVDINDGHAELSLPMSQAISGTVEIDAYMFGADSRVVRDRRLVFVRPAEDLRIEAQADAASYLPGSEAHVRFHVTDAHGKGVAAALGLEVVDEAVFALAEKQPGFAKVFFYLEQELLKPRIEVHAFSAAEIVAPAAESSGENASSEQAARVLFAAAESVDRDTLDKTFGNVPPDAHRSEFEQRYKSMFEAQAEAIALKLHDRTGAGRHNAHAAFEALQPRDAWDTPLRLQNTYWDRNQYFTLQSAGPDRVFGTADDLSAMIDVAAGTLYTPGGGRVSVRLERGHGAMNGLAEAGGCVHDISGAVVAGAAVTLLALPGPAPRRAVADASGCFSFAGIAPGAYRVRIESPGFVPAEGAFTLAARDYAGVSATLSVAVVLDAVEVNGAPMGQMEFRAAGAARGFSMGAGSPAAFALAGEASAMPRAAAAPAETQHTRSFFPEALFIAPEVLTDSHGNASVSIPMADSITTWRMAMFASTRAGALGTAVAGLKVFQDFFVDLDLPVTLTTGDRISIPVAAYNYTGARGTVKLHLHGADWFDLAQGHGEQSVDVDANSVGGAHFTINVRHAGKFQLTLEARMGSSRDTITREIEVVPNGEPHDIVFNGRLDGAHAAAATETVSFPAETLPESTKMFVRLYPGAMSQIVEGMDGILRMPYGCFEQTSSSTYPNVLALDYMKRTGKLTPEIHAKAEGFIATGYQRLLTFEVPGGGFSWFGRAPANKILTAYGLMEFHDMSRVFDVDPQLIARTRNWLIAQQQPDGSWKPDTSFINEGATNHFNSDVLRITAYIAWALESAGYNGPALEKARAFLRDRLTDSAQPDAYTLAVLANFAVAGNNSSEWTRDILQRLLAAAQTSGDQLWWTANETGVYATGSSAAVETTGLAVQALLKSGEEPESARKALAWLLSKKTGAGNWGSTQATIMALRALVLASEKAGADAVGDVEVTLNGKPVQSISLTRDNDDLLQQISLPPAAAGSIGLRFHGTGSLAYQIDGRYFVPWKAQAVQEALSIDVSYDRTRVAENDTISAVATIRNHQDAQAKMVMVDLGIPPGFELLTEDLQHMVETTAHARSGRLEKFSLTATQAILYFDSIDAGKTLKVPFRLHAKYPIRAKGFASSAYEYYDPSVAGTAAPQVLEVTAKQAVP